MDPETGGGDVGGRRSGVASDSYPNGQENQDRFGSDLVLRIKSGLTNPFDSV